MRYVILVMIMVTVVLLAGCQTFPWAHRDCRTHGGLDYVVKVGPAAMFVARCNDGTKFAR